MSNNNLKVDTKNHINRSDFKWAVKYAARILFSALVVEMSLRLTFTYSITGHYSDLISYFGPLSALMANLMRNCLFSCKYIVFYGLPSLVNKLVGMRVSQLPWCLLMTQTNAEIWKYVWVIYYFDRYLFIVIHL